MKDAGRIRTRTRLVGSWHYLKRRLVAALASLALAAFGLGCLSSPALAKDGPEITPKVIGGSVAPNGSWPSQAALLFAGQSDPSFAQFCGGTLIDRYWVLTAAHCVTDDVGVVRAASTVQVAIGINNLTNISASNRIGLKSIKVIPGWNPATYRWDFALLELASPSNQPTASLIAPDQEALTAASSPGEVAGWGCTSQTAGNCLSYPNDLLEADVNFVSNAECGGGSSYGGSFDPELMVCAGNFATGTPDTCYGDSGGPLMALGSGGERLLAGITSWGNECALPNYPGVYARVLAARSWVIETLEQNLRLTVTKSGTGSGTVTSSPSGISCGSDCSNDFAYGTVVTLTAKAASGSGFTGWSGACSGTGSCVLTIREASSVNANFKKGPTVSLKAKPPKRTHKRTAKFRFKASQSGATFQCRIDGKSWSKCKSPKTYKNLKRGRKHTFRVKARKDGITGPVRQYTWRVTK